MESLFHGPTLLTLFLALAAVRCRAEVKVFWSGAAAIMVVGLTAGAIAYVSGGIFGTLRAACWLLFAYSPVYALGSARLCRDVAPWLSRALHRAAVLILAVGVWAFGIEPRWLQISRYTVASEKIERPLRVAVLADLQSDGIGAYEKRALAALMKQEPDLILLPGDYLQIPMRMAFAREAEKLREVLRELDVSAPEGVLAVGGDVELLGWSAIFEGTGIRTFESTTRIETSQVAITALSLWESRMGTATLESSKTFHLAFGHAPDFAIGQERLEKPTVDLMVAGHTHGGQVRLPFFGPPLTFSRIPRAWASGRTDFANGGTLIVSRGVGMERGLAPPLRFLCRPEIVVIDLVPASAPRPTAARDLGSLN